MEKALQDSICDTSCIGTNADVQAVKDHLVDDMTASDVADLSASKHRKMSILSLFMFIPPRIISLEAHLKRISS